MVSEHPLEESDLWLAERLAEAAERLGEGMTVVLERLEAEHPSKAERLRSLLPSIEAMTRLALSRSSETIETFEPPVIRTLGDFQIVQVIGQGGMATVYEAVQISLNRRVALKILPSVSAQDPLKLKRFQIEAQAAACLHHPHIVPVYVVESSHGVHYYAMRLIEGRTLSDDIGQARKRARARARAEGSGGLASGADPGLVWYEPKPSESDAGQPLIGDDLDPTFRRAAELAQQAALALHYAHQQGILHRDVKPSNLLLDHAGWLYVVDFGLARIDGQVDLTQSGALIGTLRYMSPEQASPTRAVVDQRTDVYSLGAVLYEMITLRPLFEGDDRLQLLDMIAVEDPTPPRRLNPAIPRDLETITFKATAKEPADRYATAQELADDLGRFLRNEPILARAPSLFDRACKWSRRHRAAVRLSMVAVAVAMVCLGALAGWRYVVFNRHYIELRSALDLAERSEAQTRRLWYDSQVRLAHQASEAGQVEFAQELLASLRREPGGDDPRGFEWHYLWRLCQRDLSVLSRHDRPVGVVALAPDGRTLATADSDGFVILWDLVASRVRKRGRVHSRLVSGLAFAPDSSAIATWSSPGGSPSEVNLWRFAALEEPQVVPGIAGFVTSVSFSYDGARLAIVEQKTAALDRPRTTIWSLSRSQTLVARETPPRETSAFVYSPRGPRSAELGPDGALTLAPLEPGRARVHCSRPLAGASRLVFSPDGRAVAVGGEPGIAVFNADTGRELAWFAAPSLGRLEFSPNGRWLVDVAVGQQRLIVIENPTTSPRRRDPFGLVLREPRFAFAARDELLAVVGKDGPPTVWNLETARERARFPSPSSSPAGSVFTRDGRSLVLAGEDGRVRSWHFDQRGAPAEQFRAHVKEVWAVAYTPDGKHLISSGDDHNINIWDVRDHRLVRTLKGHDALVASLAVSVDGSLLASAGFDKTVRLWDLATGESKGVLAGHLDRVRSVAILGPQKLAASAGSDRTIRIWSLETGASQLVDRGHSDSIRALAADGGGRYLVSAGDDRNLRVWDLQDYQKSFGVPTAKQVSALAFSRDGDWLAVGDDWGNIVLWDARSWRPQATMKASDATIWGLAFSPGGRSLAAACDDGKVRLWDPITGQVTLVLEGPPSRVNCVAFAPDSLTLASGSHDGSITLWHAGEP